MYLYTSNAVLKFHFSSIFEVKKVGKQVIKYHILGGKEGGSE